MSHRLSYKQTQEEDVDRWAPEAQRPGWRDDSAGKSTDCSSKGPEFKFQQLHGGSQSPVMRSDALFWYV